MKNSRFFIAGCALFLSFSLGSQVLADTINTTSITALQAKHKAMINQGFSSGALTLYERRVLVRQQKRIQEIEQQFRVDGLQPQERKQLLVLLRWAEKNIERKLTNEERRLVKR